MDTRSYSDTPHDLAIARVIAHHYGDGGVYLPRIDNRRATLHRAIANGFVSDDGFITRKGRHLLARFEI